MTHGSLFSGIGGFDLAAEWMGWENIFHCEWNEFCQKILNYYWPDAKCYTDIKQTDFSIWRGRIDVITGGFPCQPYSLAGQRKGKEDDRHLWPEMLRAIREIQPRYVIGENVPGLVNWSKGMVFDEVQADLENEGYETIPIILSSASIGNDDIRERIWFCAYSDKMGRENIQGHFEGSGYQVRDIQRRREKIERWKEKADDVDPSSNSFVRFREGNGQPAIFSPSDGLPFQLDGITVPKWIEESMCAAGNAINPNVVYQIFKTIEQFELTNGNT